MTETLQSIKGHKTFPGGVHPPDSKGLSCDDHIQPGPQVKQVSILLSQHIGAVCQPLVSKGDIVKAGQKVGDCDAFVCAPVHSPIDGKVVDIALKPHVVMGRSLAVIIEATKESPVSPSDLNLKTFDINKYSNENITRAIREAGIVGMGGAGFPTSVKIQPNPQQPKETLIINGCECEPYITCDYRIMLEWTEKIIAGIKLARKASGCSQVFIGIEDNKPDAIDAFEHALANSADSDGISIVELKTKYPQGGERQIIRSILKKSVPTGGIPPMIGVVVLNVSTCAAIAEAVIASRPLTHRVVAVTGESIARPGNYYVPIGTPIGQLVEFCGGVTQKSARVIMGGPMMGISVADLDTPVTKTTGAVTIITEEQVGKAKMNGHQTACIRCGRCLMACPENLNPTKIAHAVKNNMLPLAESFYITACIECGCCSYVCPAKIDLTGYIKTGKIFLARQKKKIPK
jgi:Na+-translocating ferredoxin:NAD+ oxidoreductase subunit C